MGMRGRGRGGMWIDEGGGVESGRNGGDGLVGIILKNKRL